MPPTDEIPAADLAQRFAAVRAATVALAAPLSEADCQAQSMADTSPTKWHLAHTTWFFETFVLERFEPGFRPHHPAYRVLFNSYYNGIGEQHARPERGLITRPGLAEVLAYRRAVDERVLALLPSLPGPDGAALLELGLQHEQQHQELVLTDLLHLLSCNPLAPAYHAGVPARSGPVPPLAWEAHEGGLVEIGHDGHGFAFDNEGPRHRRWLQPFALASRLVSNGEWAAFIADGGYADPRWWLAAGWDWVRTRRVESPLYWRRGEHGDWQEFTLHGLAPLQPQAPVTHLSLYEADAYAHWAGAQLGLPLRLPTEAEWEHAAAGRAAAGIAAGNFAETGALHPQPAPTQPASTQPALAQPALAQPALAQPALTQAPSQPPVAQPALTQLFGDAWEWTASDYAPYPGFRPTAGAVGEYNGKFMVNQYVLRGGSCATPRLHIRASYRNFFPAEARWQFTGLRLACDPT